MLLVPTNPTVASIWKLERLSTSSLIGVSCSPAGQCAAYSASGQIYLASG